MTEKDDKGMAKESGLKRLFKIIFIHHHRVPLKNLLTLNIFFVMLGVACLTIASVLTFIKAFSDTLFFISGESTFLNHLLPKFMHSHLSEEFEFNAVLCKILETNLIGVILFICAVGLYFLFWKDINIPHWLQIKDVNQLKEKLIGIIITVLAVTFLEHTLEWSHPKDILMFGGAISMIILVLVFYTRVLASEHQNEDQRK